MKFHKNNFGQLSLQVLIIGFTAIIITTGFVFWTDVYVNNIKRGEDNAQAFTIAEAGIEYYRWHLAHYPDDFQDGTGEEGPYIHNYYNKGGTKIGEFKLDITPPADGTTIVVVRSTGTVVYDSTISKIIEVRMGLPSLARYSVVANANIRFGEGTEVYGQLHSNGGIRFDGVAYNVVTSAKAQYDDPDHSGGEEFGVHTHVYPTDPLPPSAIPTRTDVFSTGRDFPVPAADFVGITQDLSDIRDDSQDSCYYRGDSSGYGYELVLKTDDTFDIYKVTRLSSPPWRCRIYWQSGWGTWSIDRKTLLESDVDFPDNGLIFLEDHVWVRGQIDEARLTIAAGAFPVNPSTYKSITTNYDLLYTNYDGSDVISLMAQNNINVGLYSEDYLKVDAALVAQNGRVGRFYYKSRCGSSYKRQEMCLYGMIATNQRYGWAYTDGTGYQDRVITYDGNLLYSPPPSFPITAAQYDILSWDEVK